MPEYRTTPELDRGYSLFAIRSTLFNKNNHQALPVVVSYYCSSENDVAVGLEKDKTTGVYSPTKFKRCTDKIDLYKAILDFDAKLKKLERKNHAKRIDEKPYLFFELTPKILADMRKELKQGCPDDTPDSPHTTHTCPKCGHTFQD